MTFTYLLAAPDWELVGPDASKRESREKFREGYCIQKTGQRNSDEDSSAKCRRSLAARNPSARALT